MEFLRLLAGTVLLRPYVFMFLAAHLTVGSLYFGWRRILLFTVWAYVIAWCSEFSSIHNGFPYGLYYYIDTTRSQELWVFGVPFMDSLSYSFLALFSYHTAVFLISPTAMENGRIVSRQTPRLRYSLWTALFAALLMVFLDILTDPVAHEGEKWFLGKIYDYENDGYFFHIPQSNFGGWFLVAITIIGGFLIIDRKWLNGKYLPEYPASEKLFQPVLGILCYMSVIAFNVCVAFMIREYQLAFTELYFFLLFAIFSAVCTAKGVLSSNEK